MSQRILQFPTPPPVDRTAAGPHDNGSSGGYDGGDGMEARVARLESDVAHIRADIGEMKSDIKDLRKDMHSGFNDLRKDMYSINNDLRKDMYSINNDLRKDMQADFRLLFGALIAAVLGLAGLMAKGFHWL